MQFCEKCGAKASAAYCPKCGYAKQLQLPQMSVTYAESKFCSKCGKPVPAAYCGGCGTGRAVNIHMGRPSSYGGARVAYSPAGSAVPAAGGLPFPIEWLLMGIVLMFALSTMSFLGGLMLVCALIPAALMAYDRNLYERLKLFVGAGGAGLGLVFAILATFVGTLRFHPFALLLCIVGLLVIAFISVHEMLGIRLPGEAEKILSYVESPMYFYGVAIYFAVVTVFMRINIDFLFFRSVTNFGVVRVFLSLIFAAVLLVPVTGVAFLLWRGMNDMIDKALIALGGSAVLAVFIIPLFFRRQVGTPLLFVFLGLGAVALTGVILFTFKDAIMQVFGTGAGGAALPVAQQPYQASTYAPTAMAPGGHMHGRAPGSHPQAHAPGPGPGPGGHTSGGYPHPGVAASAPHSTTVNVNVAMHGYHQPVGQLKTNRSLLVTLLLSFITCGIYEIIQMSSISTDINIIAQRYDGRRTMHFCLLIFVISPITCGIGTLVWFHNLSGRIGNELMRRGIRENFNASTFWLWGVLGILLFGIGPLIYLYKLFRAMNLLSAHYNVNG
ncbi:MAG: DUF4234 domain-containing protein [Defluviitaleaceae bacterium]|nr:DUF4234 domain-containing protein [Defluviitaleaceae bacterium]